MEEEKHKFIIPSHERRPQPATVTIEPTSLQSHDAQSPIESPEIQQVESFPQHTYPQNAHLRDNPDASPPYPESRISSEAPVAPVAAARRVPAPAVAPSDPERQQQGMLAGWRQRFEGDRENGGKPRKTILGLTVLRFWAAVALGIIIVGVAIAVGLALGLANRPSNDSDEVKPVTQTLGVPSPAPINPYCPRPTPGINTTVTPYDASGSPIRFNNDQVMSFDVLCNTFYPQRQGINPQLRDILVMTVPDMLTCMTLCAQYNQGYSDAVGDDVFLDGGGICVGVGLVKGVAQFCHLKNATGVNATEAAGGFDVDSAVLTGDWTHMTTIEQILAFGGNVEVTSNATATVG
ncbi:uncharacterized protein ColSpa_01950 [Colletotrichum spaethianum]|uniref:Uncharacterized protein n=1 Tax=Colletotrichum spaethianum TaxID=700344 RepID=A0AA37L6Y4_9PEZI|nr:uncharacterized protein ColSpa_01950 [Colletotrichum spaethianum]GKT41769.1 hypothetical protein ColSpa_01950 [Colletotrichum spaethianum]